LKTGHAIAFVLLVLAAPGCATTWRSTDSEITLLSDTDPEERASALLDLSERAKTSPDLRPILVDRALTLLNTDDSVTVKLIALRTLGDLARLGTRAREIVPVLSHHAQLDKDFWCKIEAIESLALIAGSPTHPIDESLRAEVNDVFLSEVGMDAEADRDVRIHAAREIALLRPEGDKTLKVLVAALSDEAPDVRYHAQRALIAIAGGDHGPTKKDWEDWVRRSNERRDQPK
jgi:hypothetical protein